MTNHSEAPKAQEQTLYSGESKSPKGIKLILNNVKKKCIFMFKKVVRLFNLLSNIAPRSPKALPAQTSLTVCSVQV